MVESLAAELAPWGRVELLDEGYGDFGGPSVEPAKVLITTTDDEAVVRVFDLAGKLGLPVALRGAGHSSGGQTFAPGGIVLAHAPSVEQMTLEGEIAEVAGHWMWEDVEARLRVLGADLLVATSSVSTTVAGTLSMGGFGVRSVNHGPQVDHVSGLRLILPRGDALWCSPERLPDLFHSALTGAGQVGVIDRVRLPIGKRLRHLAFTAIEHRSFTGLATSLMKMTEQGAEPPDHLAVLIKGGRIEEFRATTHAEEAEALRAATVSNNRQGALAAAGGTEVRRGVMLADEFEASEREMPLAYWRQCRNLWCDYCLTPKNFLTFAGFIDKHASALRNHLGYVLCTAPRHGPPLALDMRPPSNGRLLSLGLFFSVPASDRPGLALARRVHEEALDLCLALGGRPYLHGLWGGAWGMSERSLDRCYGAGYQTLRRVQAQVDPLGVLSHENARGRGSSAYPSPE